MKLNIVSTVALVDINSKILIAKRPANKEYAGFWEFPGGKIKKGETLEEALKRKLELIFLKVV